MEYFDLGTLAQELKNLNEGRKYWMVRTMGGSYYGDFVRNNYIAVGFNEISLKDIDVLPEKEEKAKEILKVIFSDRYPNYRNTGYPVSQLLHFSRNIKEGDIIVIPSTSATHAAIGVVQSGMYEEEHPILDSEHHCNFKKRRKIKWLLYRRRSQLPPALQLMFSSRHILSDVTSYGALIDSVTNDFYIKDDLVHLVLRISTKNEVALDDFCDLKAINILIDDFCHRYGLIPSGESVDIKMKVQMESPGWLRLSTKMVVGLAIFGLVVVGVTGGGLQFKTKDGTEFKLWTDGVLGALSKYWDKEADRELVKAAVHAIDSLEIKSPEDIKPIIEILDKKNQGREKY